MEINLFLSFYKFFKRNFCICRRNLNFPRKVTILEKNQRSIGYE